MLKKIKIINEYFSEFIKFFIGVVLFIFLIFLIVIASKDLSAEKVEIELLECSKAVESQGFTNKSLTHLLISKANIIKNVAKSTMKGKYFSSQTDEKTFSIKIPNSDIDFNSFIYGLRSALGKKMVTVISDIIFVNGIYRLNINVSGIEATFKSKDIDAVMLKAAEFLYKEVDPYIYAAYKYRTKSPDLEDALLEVLSRKPLRNEPWALYLWGLSLLDKNNLVESEKKFRQAISKDNKFPNAYYGLGYLLRKKGLNSDAKYFYQKAIQLDPSFIQGYVGMSAILAEENKYDEALSFCYKAIKVEPNFAWTFKNIGTILQKKKQFLDAIDNYKIAIHINSHFSEAYEEYGDALLALNKYDEALGKYYAAISNGRKDKELAAKVKKILKLKKLNGPN